MKNSKKIVKPNLTSNAKEVLRRGRLRNAQGSQQRQANMIIIKTLHKTKEPEKDA